MRRAGHEGVRHGEQHGRRDVLDRSDAAHGVSLLQTLEVVPLALLAQTVPGTGVDHTRRDRVHADGGEFQGQGPGEEVDRSIGDGDPQVADRRFEGGDA